MHLHQNAPYLDTWSSWPYCVPSAVAWLQILLPAAQTNMPYKCSQHLLYAQAAAWSPASSLRTTITQALISEVYFNHGTCSELNTSLTIPPSISHKLPWSLQVISFPTQAYKSHFSKLSSLLRWDIEPASELNARLGFSQNPSIKQWNPLIWVKLPFQSYLHAAVICYGISNFILILSGFECVALLVTQVTIQVNVLSLFIITSR